MTIFTTSHRMKTAETKSMFNGVPDTWETKKVRRVRTPAGEERFGQPIGSIIIGGGVGKKLKNLTLLDSDYAGFDRVKTSKGKEFHVGNYEGESGVFVVDSDENDVYEAKNLEDAFAWLDANPTGKGNNKPTSGDGGGDSSAPKKTAAKKAPAKKARGSKLTLTNAQTGGGKPIEQRNREGWAKAIIADSGIESDEGKRVLDAALKGSDTAQFVASFITRLSPEELKEIRKVLATAFAKSGSGYGSGNSYRMTKENLESAKKFLDSFERYASRVEGYKKKGNAMGLSYKAVPIGEVEDAGTGVVEAIVAVTGLRDNVNDIIEPGAFQKSLAKRTPKGVWHHNIHESVAKTTEIKELPPGDSGLPESLPNGDPWPDNAGALKVKMEFNLATQRGKDAYEDVKFFGTDQEWSIGYNVPTGGAVIDRKAGGVRRIKTLDLYEYSPVLFGAMPNARTVSVKSAQEAHKVLLGLDTPEGLEIKSMLDEIVADEIKAAKEKDEDEEVEGDDEQTDDTEADNEADSDTSGEDEETEEDDEDEDAGTAKKKRGNTKGITLDAEGIDLFDHAVKALSELREHIFSEIETKADDEESEDTGSDSSDSSLTAMVEEAGLDATDAAAEFDDAVSNNDEAGMEDAGNTVLDAVESAKESEDVDTAILKKITGYIASAFDKIEPEEPTEEKSDDLIDYLLGWGEKRQFSGKERDKAADKGHAMDDGSFPIENESDLKNAIKACGRAKDKEAAKKHITKRARALGLTDLLPDGWGESKDDGTLVLDKKTLFEQFGVEV